MVAGRTHDYTNPQTDNLDNTLAGSRNRTAQVLPRLLFLHQPVFYSRDQMRDSTDTLHAGDHAPYFTLRSANREGTFSLSRLLQRGPVILEFLRGTW